VVIVCMRRASILCTLLILRFVVFVFCFFCFFVDERDLGFFLFVMIR